MVKENSGPEDLKKESGDNTKTDSAPATSPDDAIRKEASEFIEVYDKREAVYRASLTPLEKMVAGIKLAGRIRAVEDLSVVARKILDKVKETDPATASWLELDFNLLLRRFKEVWSVDPYGRHDELLDVLEDNPSNPWVELIRFAREKKLGENTLSQSDLEKFKKRIEDRIKEIEEKKDTS